MLHSGQSKIEVRLCWASSAGSLKFKYQPCALPTGLYLGAQIQSQEEVACDAVLAQRI